MDKYFNSYREMISLRGLTDHTIQGYSTYIKAYFEFLTDVIHKPWDVTQLPMRKFDTYLPYVPTVDEVKLFINTLPTLKQKTMVALMYSAGLRVGEVCNLKYSDIKRSSMRIHVAQAKNRSDRYAILSQKSLDMLTEYWYAYKKPTNWLFPAKQDSSKPCKTGVLGHQVLEHREKLSLNPKLNCHSFRHAFGTHLYEAGTDLLTIKELLGHKSLNSTVIYVHLASFSSHNIKSPFDMMGGDILE